MASESHRSRTASHVFAVLKSHYLVRPRDCSTDLSTSWRRGRSSWGVAKLLHRCIWRWCDLDECELADLVLAARELHTGLHL